MKDSALADAADQIADLVDERDALRADGRTIAEALAQLQSAYSVYVPVAVSVTTRERIAAAIAIAERHSKEGSEK